MSTRLASSGRSKDSRLVDEVDFEGFEHPGLGEMTDPGLASTAIVTTAWMLRIIAGSDMG